MLCEAPSQWVITLYENVAHHRDLLMLATQEKRFSTLKSDSPTQTVTSYRKEGEQCILSRPFFLTRKKKNIIYSVQKKTSLTYLKVNIKSKICQLVIAP